MATLDVYEVTLAQQFLGQALINVFFYEMGVETGDTNWAQALAQVFQSETCTANGGTWFDSAAFSDDLEIMSVNVRNLFNIAEIGGVLLGQAGQGQNTGANETPYTAYRMTSQRRRGDMRNGNKYFGGLCNGSAVNGVITPTIQGLLDTLAEKMSATLVYTDAGITAPFKPVIVKRVRSGAGTPADPYVYRLPESLDEYEGYVADNWTRTDLLTTSNRRKIGRGV